MTILHCFNPKNGAEDVQKGSQCTWKCPEKFIYNLFGPPYSGFCKIIYIDNKDLSQGSLARGSFRNTNSTSCLKCFKAVSDQGSETKSQIEPMHQWGIFTTTVHHICCPTTVCGLIDQCNRCWPFIFYHFSLNRVTRGLEKIPVLLGGGARYTMGKSPGNEGCQVSSISIGHLIWKPAVWLHW